MRRRKACCGTPTPPCTGPRSAAGAAIELFDDALRAKAERRLATAASLHRALERDEFAAPLPARRRPARPDGMVSAEALLRWQHPGPRADQPRRVHPRRRGDRPHRPHRRLGARAGLRAAGPVAASSDPSMTVAVNLSVRQLLAPRHRRARRRRPGPDSGSSPPTLCLELTESVFMGDVDVLARTLDRPQGPGRPVWPSTTSAPATPRSATSSASRSTP